MVIRQALPFDFAPRGRRAPAKTTLILGGSLAVHAAVAAYLAMMQFAPPKPTVFVEEKPIDIQFYERRKPPPPPPETKPKPREVNLHTPAANDVPTTVQTLPVEPKPERAESVGAVASLDTPRFDPPAPDPVIRNPTWLKLPGAREFARFYPDREMRMETEGKAVLNCQVTATGSVTGCKVASQFPANSGFGEAALKLSRYFVMSPRTVDGQPVEGGQVSIPIAFNLD